MCATWMFSPAQRVVDSTSRPEKTPTFLITEVTNKETILIATLMSRKRIEMRNRVNISISSAYNTDTVTPKEQNEEKDSDARHNRVNQVFSANTFSNGKRFFWTSSFSSFLMNLIFLRCENYLWNLSMSAFWNKTLCFDTLKKCLKIATMLFSPVEKLNDGLKSDI